MPLPSDYASTKSNIGNNLPTDGGGKDTQRGLYAYDITEYNPNKKIYEDNSHRFTEQNTQMSVSRFQGVYQESQRQIFSHMKMANMAPGGGLNEPAQGGGGYNQNAFYKNENNLDPYKMAAQYYR